MVAIAATVGLNTLSVLRLRVYLGSNSNQRHDCVKIIDHKIRCFCWRTAGSLTRTINSSEQSVARQNQSPDIGLIDDFSSGIRIWNANFVQTASAHVLIFTDRHTCSYSSVISALLHNAVLTRRAINRSENSPNVRQQQQQTITTITYLSVVYCIHTHLSSLSTCMAAAAAAVRRSTVNNVA